MESFQNSSILIVDDSRPFLMLMGKMLNAGGYHNLHYAISAREAFSLLGIGESTAHGVINVDLILMDLMMPGMDGHDACDLIKADHRFADVPIAMVTAKDELDAIAGSFENGFMDYIIKPFSQVEILTRVQAMLQLKHEVVLRKACEKQLADVSAQLAAAEKLVQQKDCADVLTGLNNRRYLESLLAEEWRRAMREALPMALIFIDIDDFKGYNLTHGYPAGDDCLKKLAATLKKSLGRAGDAVVRYGGEEFAVLLPNTDLAGGIAMAEELRGEIAACNIPYEKGLDGWLTVGMGLAVMSPATETTYHKLLAAADEALTMAKEAGPNQIRTGQEA